MVHKSFNPEESIGSNSKFYNIRYYNYKDFINCRPFNLNGPSIVYLPKNNLDPSQKYYDYLNKTFTHRSEFIKYITFNLYY